MPYELKVTVRTPKGRAEKASKYQADAILGFKNANRIKKKVVVNDSKYYWIVRAESEADMNRIIYGAAKSEVHIKQFYRTLFKFLGRANKLMSKWGKGAQWARKWLMKRFKKHTNNDEEQLKGFKDYLDETPDAELLVASDEVEVKRLMEKELISVKVLSNA